MPKEENITFGGTSTTTILAKAGYGPRLLPPETACSPTLTLFHTHDFEDLIDILYSAFEIILLNGGDHPGFPFDCPGQIFPEGSDRKV